MVKKRFEDPARAFRRKDEPHHSGHLSGLPPRPKRAVNVSVDAEILKVAKEMNINLSRVLERALDNLTVEERARRFYEANKASIDAHNAFIEEHGTLAEAYYGKDAFDDPSV
ncbi:MAG TPA: type II toxin-antitoxin system CcdA family antitoxin [Rhizomicrobium sp.]